MNLHPLKHRAIFTVRRAEGNDDNWMYRLWLSQQGKTWKNSIINEGNVYKTAAANISLLLTLNFRAVSDPFELCTRKILRNLICSFARARRLCTGWKKRTRNRNKRQEATRCISGFRWFCGTHGQGIPRSPGMRPTGHSRVVQNMRSLRFPFVTSHLRQNRTDERSFHVGWVLPKIPHEKGDEVRQRGRSSWIFISQWTLIIGEVPRRFLHFSRINHRTREGTIVIFCCPNRRFYLVAFPREHRPWNVSIHELKYRTLRSELLASILFRSS